MAAIPYFRLVWDDVDTFDNEKISGRGTIIPNVDSVIVAHDDDLTTLSPKAIPFTLTDGVMYDKNGNPYVQLPCDSALFGLESPLQYVVKFSGMKAPDGKVAPGFDSFPWEAPTSTADFSLASAIPATNTPGVVITKGPKGDQGEQGIPGPVNGIKGDQGVQGIPGVDGKTVRNGHGTPSPNFGNDGDFYIDIDAATIAGPKTNGAWGGSFSLVGPSGQAGTNGANGTNGTNGANGADGAPGADGAAQYATRTAFPATGVVGRVYMAIDTNLLYRWNAATTTYVAVGGSGGGTGAITAAWGYVPACNAGSPAVITHGLGSYNVDILVRSVAPPRAIRQVNVTLPDGAMTASIEPDEAWAADECRWLATAYPSDDVVSPTAPTLAASATAATTVTVTATGSTDAVGVTGYNWFRNGTYVGSTTAPTFQYGTGTGANAILTPLTPYNLTAQAYDRAGNLGTLSAVLAVTTTASPAVAFDAVGPGARSAPGAGTTGTLSWAHTVGTGGNRILVVGFVVAHGNWVANADYDALTVVSSLNGAFTRFPSPGGDVNPGGSQPSGGAHLFYLLNPSSGAHTLTATVTDTAITVAQMMAQSLSYTGVASVANAVIDAPTGGAAPVALTVPSAVGNRNVCAIAMNAAAPTGFNQTSRYAGGADLAGYADFAIIGDAAGAATSVSFTTTNSQYHAAVGINLVKA